MRPILRYCLIAMMIAIWAAPAGAHPHVWVSIQTELVPGKDGKIVAMRNRWTFDEMFSSYAVLGLDTNEDGTYDRKELAELAQVNVSSLKEFDFFTFIRLGEGYAQIKPAEDYWLEYVDSKLVLNFSLPLAEPIDARSKPMVFDIYDPTNFVSFAYGGKDAVTLGKGAPKGCAVVMPALPEQPQAMNLAAARQAQIEGQNADAAGTAPAPAERTVVVSCNKS
ncbi:MAG: DUF1007 family protein [Pseudomonadota bacterium]|nr:DUF1007 family protein [Pseudomonadota bacterium]